MTSTAQLVDICRTDMLMSGGRDQRNRLAAAATAVDVTVTLEFAHNLVANDKLSIGFEDMGVWGTAGQTVTVQRGDDSTTAAAHAIGDVVEINAHFTRGQVLRAMQAEVDGLSAKAGLFKVGYTTFDAQPGDWTYNLAVDPDRIISVEGESLTDEDEWYPVGSWSVRRDGDGTELVLHDGWDGTIRVAFRGAYSPLTADAADVAAATGVGDPTLVAVGAALRLTRGRPIRRTFVDAQGDSRRANEVVAFHTEQSDQNLERWYRMLLLDEQARLTRRFPPRRR